MKHTRVVLFALLFGVCAGSVAAQGIPGDPKADKYYVGLHGGATIISDSELSGSDIAVTGFSNVEAEFSTRFNIGGLLGYKFKNGLRLEGEYTYRQADFDDITGTFMGTSGSLSSLGIGVGGDV